MFYVSWVCSKVLFKSRVYVIYLCFLVAHQYFLLCYLKCQSKCLGQTLDIQLQCNGSCLGMYRLYLFFLYVFFYSFYAFETIISFCIKKIGEKVEEENKETFVLWIELEMLSLWLVHWPAASCVTRRLFREDTSFSYTCFLFLQRCKQACLTASPFQPYPASDLLSHSEAWAASLWLSLHHLDVQVIKWATNMNFLEQNKVWMSSAFFIRYFLLKF